MSSDRRSERYSGLAILLGLLCGCDFSVDSSLVRKPETDAGQVSCSSNGGNCPGDGGGPSGGENTGGSSGGSGGQTSGGTTSGTTGIAGIDLPCNTQADCSANRGLYACRSDGDCVDRCSADGCLGSRLEVTVERAVGTSSGFLYQTADTTDGIGNSRNTKAVWFWNGQEAPREIQGTRGTTLLFGTDDAAFVQTQDGKLVRAPLVAGVAEQLATGVSEAWKSAQGVMWSSSDPNTDRFDPKHYELWERPLSQGATATRIAQGPEPFIAHNADYFFTYGPPAVLRAVKRSTGVVTDLQTGVFVQAVVADEKYVYFGNDGRIVRILLSDPSDKKNLSPVGSSSSERIWLEGDWVYWTVSKNGSQVGRSHRDLLDPLVTFDPFFTPEDQGVLAISKNRALYPFAAKDGNYLALRTLSAIPCSARLNCPPGFSCTRDSVCK